MPRRSPAVDFSNSNRLDRLMRAGRIYLSLDDAIALALENNLDIEFARFNPRIADTDVMRASAGSIVSGLGSTGVRSGPSSARGALAGVSGVSSGGGGGSSSQSGLFSGVSVQMAGSGVPNLEPTAFVNGQYGHSTDILTNSFATGTNYLVSNYRGGSYGISKGFLTGTTVQLSMNNSSMRQNSPRNDFNPSLSGGLSLSINQSLLQGFGRGLNSRYIKAAKNSRHAADLAFKAQVIATVANVVSLYYDLVYLNELFQIRQQALELNTKLYTDNKRRAELGAIAPIDIIQAEAEVAASQQEVTNAETQVLQQEMILKNVLTRTGIDNMALADARIVPTTSIAVPEKEPVEPVQDLVTEAMASRPEIEQSVISLENSRLGLKGTRNALLPHLTVGVSMSNNALAGEMNTVTLDQGAAAQLFLAQRAAALNPFFVGGYGRFFSQIFSRNFPNYGVGFQLNVPLRNRSAQADFIRGQLNYRQQQINDRQTRNNIRLNVINARTALSQARAAYDTSVKARMLSEQTLAGERRKYQLGTSAFLNVVIVQREMVNRRAAEATALNSYINSRTNLQFSAGRILQAFNISMDEAYTGVARREPDLLPALPEGAQ
jgi:outer membrane protein TolC